jgi:cytochrome c oxidase subunit 6a
VFLSVVVCGAWVYNLEAEHEAHNAHLREENGGKLPEPPAYDYLNRRVKPFPWGMNSLFFNPRVRSSTNLV